MRAIEYIENFKKSISNYDILKRIIKDLMPLRLDRDATEKYYDKYLINDIQYESHLFSLKEWEFEGSNPLNRPEFIVEDSFISQNDACKIREDLLMAIFKDKSFGYLFYFLASERNRKDPTDDSIRYVPDNEEIKDAVKGYIDLYSSYNLIDFLENDFNYNFYNQYNWLYDLDEEWINIFNDAYNLFDNIRVNLNTPDNALKYIKDYEHPVESIKLTIVLFLCDLFIEYKYDLDEKAERKFEIFHRKLKDYHNSTYRSVKESTQTKTTKSEDNNELNWRDRTNNFDCDTIEKVVKSYNDTITQIDILSIIQREFKKEKVKSSWGFDLIDVNQFCELLKEELKSNKLRTTESEINKYKSIIIIEKDKDIELKDKKIELKDEIIKELELKLSKYTNIEKNEKEQEPITKSLTTFQQVLVFYYLFDYLGINFGNSDKSQWIKFIHKFTGKNEQNIKEKLYIDFDTKETKKNLRLIAPLFSALFSKIEEKIKIDSKE